MSGATRNVIERLMVQWRIVVTVCLVGVAAGVWSFLTMPRQEFPEFTVRQGLVIGVMPGASVEEVEQQLTRPVEEFLFGFNEVNKEKTTSVSRAGQVVIFVEVDERLGAYETREFWATLRHGLNELKQQQLSSRVVALIGTNDFGDTSALLFTVSAPGRSPRDLERYTEALEARLRRLPATAKLRRVGQQQEVVRVTIAREQLARSGVRPASVYAALQGVGGPPLPARLDQGPLELPVHLGPVLRSESELGETLLAARPDGPHVRLKDVAEIRREYGHDDSHIRFDGQPALLLSIEMKPGHDITAFGEQVDGALQDTLRLLPPGVQIARVADQPHVVGVAVDHFLRDFGLAIASVILVTMLLLPIRVASVAAVTIPVCIAITLGILDLLGVALQTVSLAGLIVVLGMVVDNAIVVIDDHVEKLDRGLDRWSAAHQSARELAVPVFAATVAIVCAYVPMTYVVGGVAGEFLGSLPVTVTVALLTSLAVSLGLVPILCTTLIRRGLRREDGRGGMLGWLQRRFDSGLELAFRHPLLTVAAGVAAIVGAGAIAARLPQESFPMVERDQFAVEVYLPNGRSLAETDAVIRGLEQELKQDARIRHVTAFVGQGSPRFHTLYAPQMPARNYGQLLVNTVSEEATLQYLRANKARLEGTYPQGWVQLRQLSFLPTAPVEVRLYGDDLDELRRLAGQIKTFARTLPGTTWVRDNHEDTVATVEVIPDPEACSRLGVPPSLLQLSLALGLQGFPVATLWEGDDPIQVLLEDDAPARTTLDALRQQTVSSTLAGAAVPLAQVARVQPGWSRGALVHRNGVRSIMISVELAMGANATVVQRQLEPFVAGLPKPPGVWVDYGGEKEMSAVAMDPMQVSLAVTVVLIFLVLLVQFQRFRKALLVMGAMPLALLGAFAGLALLDYPFGFVAFMGVISLMGIVVRNGIILISYADHLQREGLTVREAALAAGKRRMRPIYLTSMAAAIGVVPLIVSGSTLWGPLGTVTCFGLIGAMVLTLFVLPVAYWLITPERRQGDQPRAALAPVTAAGAAGGAALVVLLLGVGLAWPATARAQTGAAGPLTLEQARTLAVAHSVALRTARLEVEAAQEQRAAAFTRYFPEVSAVGFGMLAKDPLLSYETQGGNLPVYDGNPASLMTASQFAYLPGGAMAAGDSATVLALSAVQPLYLGGRLVAGNRLAALGVEVAEEQARLARREVQARTDEKYWRLVTLNGKLGTIGAFETLLAELERQVGSAVGAGLTTRGDALKVALQRHQLAADRARLQDGILLASADLRQQLGLPAAALPLAVAGAPPTPADPTPLQAELADGPARRTELRLLERAQQAAALQTALERGKHLPSLAVGATVMRSDVAGAGEPLTNAMLFGVASLPLSAWWGGQHAVSGLERKERIAAARLADTRELLALDVRRAWDELSAAWREVQLAEEAVAAGTVDLQEATSRHAAGLVTVSDLLESQGKLQQAQDRRLEARSAYWLGRAALLRAVERE